MDPAFCQAVRPKRHVVLGLKLEPLTLGHVFTLAKHGSPYVEESTGDTGFESRLADLMLAVFVCSNGWRNSERFITSGWPFGLYVWAWSRGLSKMILPIEASKFGVYLNEGHAAPAVTFERKEQTFFQEETRLGAPYYQRTLSMLMSDFHMTMGEALDMELAQAHAIWAADMERKGHCKMWAGSRREGLLEFAARMDRERLGKERN